MKLTSKKFKVLNDKLQSLLEEQSDLELLLNPLVVWSEKDIKYKNWLDIKYAGIDFDISRNWSAKVKREKEKKNNKEEWNENIIKENEEKKIIFLNLKNRLDNINSLIERIIKEINPEIEDLTDEQLELIFKWYYILDIININGILT